MRIRIMLVSILIMLVFLSGCALNRPEPAASPQVIGSLKYTLLKLDLLKGEGNISWYDPNSVSDSMYLFNYKGKKAFMVSHRIDTNSAIGITGIYADPMSIQVQVTETRQNANGVSAGMESLKNAVVIVVLQDVYYADNRNIRLNYVYPQKEEKASKDNTKDIYTKSAIFRGIGISTLAQFELTDKEFPYGIFEISEELREQLSYYSEGVPVRLTFSVPKGIGNPVAIKVELNK